MIELKILLTALWGIFFGVLLGNAFEDEENIGFYVGVLLFIVSAMVFFYCSIVCIWDYIP